MAASAEKGSTTTQHRDLLEARAPPRTPSPLRRRFTPPPRLHPSPRRRGIGSRGTGRRPPMTASGSTALLRFGALSPRTAAHRDPQEDDEFEEFEQQEWAEGDQDVEDPTMWQVSPHPRAPCRTRGARPLPRLVPTPPHSAAGWLGGRRGGRELHQAAARRAAAHGGGGQGRRACGDAAVSAVRRLRESLPSCIL